MFWVQRDLELVLNSEFIARRSGDFKRDALLQGCLDVLDLHALTVLPTCPCYANEARGEWIEVQRRGNGVSPVPLVRVDLLFST
jgi:hypothetical protein